jgi:hypothetical protein
MICLDCYYSSFNLSIAEISKLQEILHCRERTGGRYVELLAFDTKSC